MSDDRKGLGSFEEEISASEALEKEFQWLGLNIDYFPLLFVLFWIVNEFLSLCIGLR